jgi:lipopolysaccharide transport protein LptA
VTRALSILAAGLVLLAGVFAAAGAAAVVDVSGPARGIAVVPFSGASPEVAARLAGELEARSKARIVAPGAVRLDERGLDDPQARDVRRWAQWNAVENVVVGRQEGALDHGLDVRVELRSGHSGAPRASYRLAPAEEDGLDGAVQRLAQLILADAGETAETATDDSRDEDPAALPGVSAPAPGDTAPGGASQDDSGGSGIALIPGVARDDPISINSDELEVLPQDGGRRLVFSRNVEVQQGGITLHANRLEAVYPQGASQPDLLVATGDVRVAQGDRRGRCEEATYERQAHTIICRGRAEVIQGCDQVRGEEIQFDLEQEKVRVLGAASVLIQSEDAPDAECARDATEAAGAR